MEGEVKNMIFSLLDVRRVSGISYGSRAQWPRLFEMLGKTFLTMMKLDVQNSKRGGNMPAYNTRLLLFSLKITFVICNVEFRWFLSGSEPIENGQMAFLTADFLVRCLLLVYYIVNVYFFILYF